MEEQKKESKMYTVEKGKVIAQKDQPITQLLFLLKGTVKIENAYMRGTMKTGDIIGLMGIGVGKFLFTYTAQEDATVYPVDIGCVEDVKKLFQMGKDYKRYTVACMVKQVKEFVGVYRKLEDMTEKLSINISEGYQKYASLCKSYQKKPKENQEMKDVKEERIGHKVDAFWEEYFLSLGEIPAEVSNAFFNASEYVSYAHVEKGSLLIHSLHDVNRRLMKRFMTHYKLLVDENENNLLSYYYMLGMEIIAANGNQTEVLHEVEKLMRLILEIKGSVESTLNIAFPVDKKRINDMYKALKSTSKEDASHGQLLTSHTKDQIDQAMDAIKDSLKKILRYSEIGKEKSEQFESLLLAYQNLPDQNSADDDARKLRRDITKLYYQIYQKAFFRSVEEKDETRLVQMFLDFGFMDEKMVEKETAVELYFLDTRQKEGSLSVFTISRWLRAIYEGEREPSKSSFDLDYREHLRELRKRKEITEAEEAEMLVDGKKKVCYEIENMLSSNNRVTNGKLSVFCPVLKQSDFMGEIGRLFLSCERIAKSMDDLLKVDFSAFHREAMYQDLDNNIEKAYIQKQVLPDFILMPNVGENGIMWQEISDRKRDAPGRFILPIFLLKDLDAAMAYMVGCFRWELCRTIQGVYWNDLREKSLTSEYSDYVQFYRKNRDLSEDARQKVKMQLQKCRNRTREMFAKDYELWVRFEHTGSVRLNKVARSILFTYCPFAREYREKLALQPMYQEAAAKYDREHQKEIKRIRNLYTSLKGNGATITPVLEDNLKYLEEM